MESSKKKRTLAWVGISILTLLFLMTVVFLIVGNMPMAVTMIALNGLVLFIIYFTLRFNRNVHDQNPDLFPDDEEEDQ